MGGLLFLMAVAGLLTGGAMGAVARTHGSRRGWLLAVAMAAAAALCLWVSLARLRKL
ncbi:MAG: hypothetical protein ABJC62_14545 [Frankiaceae bacterium]